MAQDRFVYWKEERPTRKELKGVLEDFLGGMAVGIKYGTFESGASKDKDLEFWSILLVGKPSFPFKRLPGFGKGSFGGQEMHTERWFEVVVAPDSIDVITRMSDELTSVIANGFAELCARYWQTKVSR